MASWGFYLGGLVGGNKVKLGMAKKWKPVWHECKCGNWFRLSTLCEACCPMDYRAEVRRVSKINRAFLPMFGKVELVIGPGNDVDSTVRV